MQFTKIDINNWTRKEYFDHYFGNTPCTYSMTVKLDISKLKKDGKKLYPTLLYGVTTIINRHEEFRTALDENGQVGVFSEMLPCYTVFHKETETFSSIWTEFTADYTEFLQNYQKDIDAFGERMGMSAKPNPPENTFPVSMIPWTSFEGFNLNLKKGYDYLLPIFTFGKYYEEGGKYYIPFILSVESSASCGASFPVSALINISIEWAKHKNLHGLMLETQDNNLIACKFYHNCGFKIGSVDTMLYANFENNFEKAVFWYLRF